MSIRQTYDDKIDAYVHAMLTNAVLSHSLDKSLRGLWILYCYHEGLISKEEFRRARELS